MCKKNELIGSSMMSCGAGLLLSFLFSSEFAMGLIGVGLLVAGLLCTRKQ